MFQEDAAQKEVKWRCSGHKSGGTSRHVVDHQEIPTLAESETIYWGKKCTGTIVSQLRAQV